MSIAQAPERTEQRLLTIGSVCRSLQAEFPDISISKIRYLEDQKLLAPRRTPGGPVSMPRRVRPAPHGSGGDAADHAACTPTD